MIRNTVISIAAAALAFTLPCTALANDNLTLMQDLAKMISEPEPDAQVQALFSKYPDLGTLPKSPYDIRTPINTVLDHCISPTAGVCSPATIRRVVEAGGDLNDVMDAMPYSMIGIALTHQAGYGGQRAKLFEATNTRLKQSTQAMTAAAGIAALPKPATNAEFLEVLKTVLNLGVDPNGKDMSGFPLLYTALDLGPEFARALMDAGADTTETIALIEADIANARRVQSAINGR